MCTPTRAALLTGRYPQRMGFERAFAKPGRDWRGLAEPGMNEITVATYLRQTGYATGIFGKWHLGKHPSANPLRFGFDEFRGLTDGDAEAGMAGGAARRAAGLPRAWLVLVAACCAPAVRRVAGGRWS